MAKTCNNRGNFPLLMTFDLHAQGIKPRWAANDLLLWAFPVIVLILVKAVNPVDYVGGGGDDWHYLQAARCAAAHGLCLPPSHWWARFPLILPMAAAMRIAGESHGSIAFVPALYSAAVLLLLTANVRHIASPLAATAAASIFALTPIFAHDALQPLVDHAELAWVLVALLAIQIAEKAQRGHRAAAVAGIALALAVMTRMTAITFIPIAGLMLFATRRRRIGLAVPVLAGFGGVLAIEAVGYWIATGSPLYGWMLSLHHTRVPTTELLPGVDLTRSPILNLDYIRGWRRSAGINVHWSVDPLLNLLADPYSGLTIAGAFALAILNRDTLGDRRWIGWITLAGILHFVLLTYVLAVDPKPRMFLAEVAIASIVAGVLGIDGWRCGIRLLPAALGVLLIARAFILSWDTLQYLPAEQTAHQWIAAIADDVAIEEKSRRVMTIDPVIGGLPIDRAGKSHFVTLARGNCTDPLTELGSDWRIERAARFHKQDPAPIAWLRARNVMIGTGETLTLCLFKRRQDPAGSHP